ncbi:MAG TPA: NrtA/SsuA/CpmA family ABC transporter substrate-binding protein [Selenomonadales bacterium]|nr:NrtA/SsuA/CpmA family ABC transporter substrate-binding protein [Selenomonadales bacterium]
MMYSMKKGLSLLAILLALTVTVSGCSREQQAAAEKPKAVNVTYVKAPLNIPSIVEKQTGAFDKEFGKDGITVSYPEITAGPKQTEAMAAGSVDFAHCLGGTAAILAAANGVDLKITGIYSRAPKAFELLAKDQGIQSVKDLKGKKVAGPKGTVLHQLLLTALDKNGMKADDVEFITMDIPGAVAALMNGSVDAALAAGPDALKAEMAGARVITNGEGLVEATIVTAVRGEFYRKYPDLVQRFMKTHYATLDYIKNNQEEALKMTAAETGLTIDMVKRMAPLYDFDARIKPSDIEELKATQEFLLKNGMLTKQIDIEQLIVK